MEVQEFGLETLWHQAFPPTRYTPLAGWASVAGGWRSYDHTRLAQVIAKTTKEMIMATYIKETDTSSGPLAIVVLVAILAAAAFGIYYFTNNADTTPDRVENITIETPVAPAPAPDTAPIDSPAY